MKNGVATIEFCPALHGRKPRESLEDLRRGTALWRAAISAAFAD
jgi:hypothetical protein